MVTINGSSGTSLLEQIQQRQNQRLEQLASGQRINSAADGAAAQQIVERLTSQIEGNRQAVENTFDGISLVQTAEGGLSGINDDVNRIRELTLQSGSGIIGDTERQAIQNEISQLQDNISQTIEQTTFAGQPLLSDNGQISFQVGADSGQTVDVNTRDFNTELTDVLNVDVTTQTLQDSLDAADAAIETIGSARGELGAAQNRFDSTIRRLTQADVDASAARSRIADADFARTSSELARDNFLGQSAISVQSQANANQGQVLSLLS